MYTYALLANPSYVRVSYQDWKDLACAELSAAALSAVLVDVRVEHIGGVEYILFDMSRPVIASDIQILSRLSFVHALFQRQMELLRPLEKSPGYFLDGDLSAILKYSGKTNELFTRLMLNLAAFHIGRTKIVPNPSGNLNILDPLAGKGTTLFEAMMQNHNAYGVEVDSKIVQESQIYLKKYLETARYKHSTHTEKISGSIAAASPGGTQGRTVGHKGNESSRFTAVRYQIETAPSKSAGKDGGGAKFEMIAGDTRYTAEYFRKNHFHAIIADLPYGVQHGSKAANKIGSEGNGKTGKKPHSSSMTRNALGLIKESLPSWLKTLKSGGVIVLAWNLFLIPRGELEDVFTAHGLTLPENQANFKHRVDQAIDRDIIIGVKN